MLEVFTVGGGDYLVNTFNAIAAWTGSGGFKALIRVCMVMGLIYALLVTAMDLDWRAWFRWFIQSTLIYLVLILQFGNFRDPLVVLLGSVPLGLSGALMFSFFDVTTINLYSQVGLITMVGLIAKNGILIVEFANRLRAQGLSRIDAARDAAISRLRPVLMTTVATIVGHLPLVFVSGPGSGARNSIGLMLVSGMAIGTVFTLFVLPCVYSVLAARPRHSDAHDEAAAHPDPALASPAQ